MLKFASTIDDCKDIIKMYQDHPDSFNLGQSYILLEMMYGLSYGQQSQFDDFEVKLLDIVKNKDKTDTLAHNLKKYDIMRLSTDDRLSTLIDYMLNKDNKYSAADIDIFSSALASRFISLDIRRQYYSILFNNIMQSIDNNTNMYTRVNISLIIRN